MECPDVNVPIGEICKLEDEFKLEVRKLKEKLHQDMAMEMDELYNKMVVKMRYTMYRIMLSFPNNSVVNDFVNEVVKMLMIYTDPEENFTNQLLGSQSDNLDVSLDDEAINQDSPVLNSVVLTPMDSNNDSQMQSSTSSLSNDEAMINQLSQFAVPVLEQKANNRPEGIEPPARISKKDMWKMLPLEPATCLVKGCSKLFDYSRQDHIEKDHQNIRVHCAVWHCALCPNHYTTYTTLDRHYQNQHAYSYQCTFASCAFTSKTNIQVTKHFEERHMVSAIVNNPVAESTNQNIDEDVDLFEHVANSEENVQSINQSFTAAVPSSVACGNDDPNKLPVAQQPSTSTEPKTIKRTSVQSGNNEECNVVYENGQGQSSTSVKKAKLDSTHSNIAPSADLSRHRCMIEHCALFKFTYSDLEQHIKLYHSQPNKWTISSVENVLTTVQNTNTVGSNVSTNQDIDVDLFEHEANSEENVQPINQGSPDTVLFPVASDSDDNVMINELPVQQSSTLAEPKSMKRLSGQSDSNEEGDQVYEDCQGQSSAPVKKAKLDSTHSNSSQSGLSVDQSRRIIEDFGLSFDNFDDPHHQIKLVHSYPLALSTVENALTTFKNANAGKAGKCPIESLQSSISTEAISSHFEVPVASRLNSRNNEECIDVGNNGQSSTSVNNAKLDAAHSDHAQSQVTTGSEQNSKVNYNSSEEVPQPLDRDEMLIRIGVKCLRITTEPTSIHFNPDDKSTNQSIDVDLSEHEANSDENVQPIQQGSPDTVLSPVASGSDDINELPVQQSSTLAEPQSRKRLSGQSGSNEEGNQVCGDGQGQSSASVKKAKLDSIQMTENCGLIFDNLDIIDEHIKLVQSHLRQFANSSVENVLTTVPNSNVGPIVSQQSLTKSSSMTSMHFEVPVDSKIDSRDNEECIEVGNNGQSSTSVNNAKLDAAHSDHAQSQVTNVSEHNSKVNYNSTKEVSQPLKRYDTFIRIGHKCFQSNCKRMFDTEEKLNHHMWKRHRIRECPCLVKDCGESFDDICSRNEHFKKDHKDRSEWRCAQCWNNYKSLQGLSRHYNCYHTDQWQCTFASCSFSGNQSSTFYHYVREHMITCREFDCANKFYGFLYKSYADLDRDEQAKRVHYHLKPINQGSTL